jgi:hypothetical protein
MKARNEGRREMTTPTMTRHASARQPQRAIPPLVVDWLLAYGMREKSFGAVKVRFDKRARRDLSRDVGKRALSLMSKYLRTALVVDPETDRIKIGSSRWNGCTKRPP